MDLASRNGYIDLVEAIIEYESDLDQTQKSDPFSPIHYAIIGGYLDIVHLLCFNDYDVNKYSNMVKSINMVEHLFMKLVMRII